MISILFMLCLVQPTANNVLWLQPFDFQEGLSDAGFDRIDQLSSDGDVIYVTSVKSTTVAVIDLGGRVLNTFGGSGGHPAEMGQLGIYAFLANGRSTWAIDTNSSRARRYEAGIYQESFALGTTRLVDGMPGATLIAASGDTLVIPIRGKDDVIARVISSGGEIKQEISSPLVFDQGMKRFIQGIDDTLWLHKDNHWYSINRYLPVITRYDANFEIAGMVRFRNRTTAAMKDRLENFAPSEKFGTLPAMITDAQFYKGQLYLMCGLELLKVDADTGAIKASWEFRGKGENFGRAQDVPLRLFSFTLLQDKVVLAHPGLMWGHDLWLVDLPQIPGS